MSTSAIILEYFRIFLSTPVMIGAVSATSLFLFKDQIRSLLMRIALIKLGGAELSAPQPPPETPLLTDETTPGFAPSGKSQELAIRSDIDLSTNNAEQLGIALQEERKHALLWEFRFLNYFLVPVTQNVLDWFANLTTPTTATCMTRLGRYSFRLQWSAKI